MLRLPLSLSLAGLPLAAEHLWGDNPRSVIAWAASVAARAVQLDATMAGIRPRELDRSARRDLASLLRREQLAFSGLDLWIPVAHFADAATIDRALAAATQAAELCSDLAQLSGSGRVVSLALPTNLDPAVLARLSSAAERSGIRFADHTLPARSITDTGNAIGLGIDAAAALMHGLDPAKLVWDAPHPPIAARLGDADSVGRAVAGKGRLERANYEASLITRGFADHLIVDLRGLPDPSAAAAALLKSET